MIMPGKEPLYGVISINNMNQNKGVWIGGIAIVVVIVLGLWWISVNQSVNSSTNMASSTSATSTDNGNTPSVIDRSSTDVKTIVASISGASQFQSLFSSTGVSALIKNTGQYTIFVPTDGAFSDLPKGTLSSMTAAQLKRLVEYHIVSGKAIQPGDELAGNIQALSGDPLNFSDNNNIVMVNSSIIVSEYKGSNGVVYVINNVLVPPQK
jgi:uncharacterized surface protein with fasciclin (FAS1) repeats